MAKGPCGERRPADAGASAVMVAKVATHKSEEESELSTAAAELGRRGREVRALKMSPKRRREIAQAAARARYAKR